MIELVMLNLGGQMIQPSNKENEQNFWKKKRKENEQKLLIVY